MTYDEAKEVIAKTEMNRESWKEVQDALRYHPNLYEHCHKLAAELYARNLANEKVKEVKLKLISAGLYELDGAGYFPATQLIEELPLPFQEK